MESTMKENDMCKAKLSCCAIRNWKRNAQTVSGIRKLPVEFAIFSLRISVTCVIAFQFKRFVY